MTFTESKVAGLCVLTRELVRSSDPPAQEVVRADLSAACASFIDTAFLDQNGAGTPDVAPPSITFAATTIVSTGINAAAFSTDFQALVAAISTNLTQPALIMKPRGAMNIELTRDVGATGGSIAKISVITSENVPKDAAGHDIIVLIDGAEVLLADGPVELSASEQALVEMAAPATHPVSASTVLRSTWQQDLLGVKCLKFLNWQRRRENCVAVLAGIDLPVAAPAA